MNYYKILKILDVDDNVLGYMKELKCKFYKIKEDINKYGKDIFIIFYKDYRKYYKNIDNFYNDYNKYDIEIINNFIKNDKFMFFDNIDDYIREKEMFEKYDSFYKNKYRHRVLYKKFKEGIVLTDEELEYIRDNNILDGFKDNEINLSGKYIDD